MKPQYWVMGYLYIGADLLPVALKFSYISVSYFEVICVLFA